MTAYPPGRCTLGSITRFEAGVAAGNELRLPVLVPRGLRCGRGMPSKLLLHAAVATSGAAVMILELVGTRVIGPFYGAGLFVWTALVAVTLIALAAGYWLGGVLSDRAPSLGLEWPLAAAGLLCALVPALARPVLLATDALGLRGGAFCSALLLFLLPLMSLGTIGPLAVQRSSGAARGSVGLTVGRVFALSTLGSVVATLLFGFFLLPSVGWRAVLVGLGALLLLVAALVRRADRGRGQSLGSRLLALALLAVVALAPWIASGPPPAPGRRVLFDTEGLHGRVRVIDDEAAGLRWLLSDACTIGAAELGSGRCGFPYVQILAESASLRPEARRALLVGVGSGFLAQELALRGLEVDCIEIDPAVAAAARECFGFRPEGWLLLGDARYLLRRLGRRYDLVLHDCFTGGSMPAHLYSLEALRDVKRCLTPGGLLALNFVGGRRSRAVACVAASLGATFGFVESIVVQPDEPLTDVIFLASDRPFARVALEVLASSGGREAPRATLGEYEQPGGSVLTDDCNPLELLQAGTTERYRAMLVARIPPDVLGR